MARTRNRLPLETARRMRSSRALRSAGAAFEEMFAKTTYGIVEDLAVTSVYSRNQHSARTWDTHSRVDRVSLGG